jgi:hypothetical protein
MKRFEMWCWRKMEKIVWTDCVRNLEVLQTAKEERNTLKAIIGRKVNCIWLRKCLLEHVIEGNIDGGIEVTRKRERRRKKVLNDFMENRKYWKSKEKAVDRSLCTDSSAEVL